MFDFDALMNGGDFLVVAGLLLALIFFTGGSAKSGR